MAKKDKKEKQDKKETIKVKLKCNLLGVGHALKQGEVAEIPVDFYNKQKYCFEVL